MTILNFKALYKEYSYTPGDEKIYVGQDGDQRKCRFCGTTLSKEHFSNDAHAISYALGNDTFFCIDECNSCNQSFGNRLEQDIVAFLQMHLLLHKIQTRKGKRTVSGRNFDMYYSPTICKDITENEMLTLHMRNWKNDDATIEDVIKYVNSSDLSNKTCAYQNVYKALCKYAISLLPTEVDLRHFENTAKWICNATDMKAKLPKVICYYPAHSEDRASMSILIRKGNDENLPFCIALLNLKNISFFFNVPLFNNIEASAFWEQVIKGAETSRVETIDLSSTIKKPSPFRINGEASYDEAYFLKRDSVDDDWTICNLPNK